jgi:hypothetical protein
LHVPRANIIDVTHPLRKDNPQWSNLRFRYVYPLSEDSIVEGEFYFVGDDDEKNPECREDVDDKCNLPTRQELLELLRL